MPLGIQDIYFIFALLIAGAIAGYASGLFGIGGGLILVPLFLTLFPLIGTTQDQVMHCSVGTSLALILPNCWASMRKHRQLGSMDTTLLKSWLPFIILGAVIGLTAINIAPTAILKIIFTLYLYAMFAFVLFKKDAPLEKEGQPGLRAQFLGGITFGALCILLGVGGGAFTTPFLKMFRYPLRRALAISSATGLTIAAVGTIGIIFSGWGEVGRAPYSLGFVNIPAFLIVTPMALWLAPHGVHLAHRVHNRLLHRCFATLLLVMAIYMTGHVFHDV